MKDQMPRDCLENQGRDGRRLPRGSMVKRVEDLHDKNIKPHYRRYRESIESWIPRTYSVSDSGCWEWKGTKNSGGYAKTKIKGKTLLGHRMMYEFTHGSIPQHLTLDHLCRNRSCVNPQHLEPVTMKENLLRGNGACAINKRKTKCKRGHPFGKQTKFNLNKGNRMCHTCAKLRKPRRKFLSCVDCNEKRFVFARRDTKRCKLCSNRENIKRAHALAYLKSYRAIRRLRPLGSPDGQGKLFT